MGRTNHRTAPTGEHFAEKFQHKVGPKYDTTTAAGLLNVTEQELHTMRNDNLILGLPGTDTIWFPAWQVKSVKNGNKTEYEIYDAVPQIIQAFAQYPHLNSSRDIYIASWANTIQYEDLYSTTPALWLASGLDEDMAVTSAQRAAYHLAQ